MEDLLIKLAEVEHIYAGRDRKFIRSVARRANKGEALTTRQGWAFLAILRNNPIYSEIGMKKEALDAMVAKPQWRVPLVPSVELKSEVRHLGDNMLGFRTSDGRTEIDLAALKSVYSNGLKIVTIDNKATLDAVISFIGSWHFEMDEATEAFLSDCLDHVGSPIRVVLHGDQLIIDVPNQLAFGQFAQHLLGAEIL